MRTKVIIIGICIFIIAVIQSTVLDYTKIFNVKPNLLVVFIISMALLRGNIEGAVIGFFAGLTHDIISGKVFGFYALMGLFLGLIIGSFNKRLYRENVLIAVFFTFVSSFIYEGTVYLLNIARNYLTGNYTVSDMNFIYAFKNIVFPIAVYNSAVSILIYILSIKLNRRIEEAHKNSRRY